jgi:hypothetical protein
VRLHLLHPEVATRDCDHCLKYAYDENTGAVDRYHGEPRRRHRKEKPDCQTPAGCPKGTPEAQVSLSDRNLLFWRRYQVWRLTGDWPTDRLSLYICRLVSGVERQCQEAKQNETLRLLQQPTPC